MSRVSRGAGEARGRATQNAPTTPTSLNTPTRTLRRRDTGRTAVCVAREDYTAESAPARSAGRPHSPSGLCWSLVECFWRRFDAGGSDGHRRRPPDDRWGTQPERGRRVPQGAGQSLFSGCSAHPATSASLTHRRFGHARGTVRAQSPTNARNVVVQKRFRLKPGRDPGGSFSGRRHATLGR